MDRWRRSGATIATSVALAAILVAAPPPAASAVVREATTPRSVAEDGWRWPVDGPILRAFDAPDSPYARGHRGIDVAAARGTPVVAPADGVVTAVGRVGSNRYVSIEVGDALVTLSFLGSVSVRVGDAVERGVPVARSGDGHPAVSVPHVHVSVRFDGIYVDPFPLFEPLDVSPYIRLVPVED